VRKPRAYLAKLPGDIVQVDTLDLRPLPGVVLKHFTARDVVSRWDVLEVHTRATAKAAASFLDAIQARMPFPVRAIQVDGGSEFQAQFERACQQRGIRLFVLPPRSPKLNGRVERAQRTHTEEFYQVWDLTWTVADLNRQLRPWERIYNTVRPHQALGYRTPKQLPSGACARRQRASRVSPLYWTSTCT
jgi:transposase InsO family protein